MSLPGFVTRRMETPGLVLLAGTVVGLTRSQFEARQHLLTLLRKDSSNALFVCKPSQALQFKVGEPFLLPANITPGSCLQRPRNSRRRRESRAVDPDWPGYGGSEQAASGGGGTTTVSDFAMGEEWLVPLPQHARVTRIPTQRRPSRTNEPELE
jgi:hypothetical protein